MMPVYVLHCDELPARTAGVRAHMDARGIDATYYRGFHGKTWGLRTVLEYDKGKVISPGHVGLNLGVWALWQHIHLGTAGDHTGRRDGPGPNDPVIIFEDDVTLPELFASQLVDLEIQLRYDFPDWDLVFLGLAEVEPRVWHKVTERIGKPDSRLCRLSDPFGTHAIMLRRRALPILLDNMTAAQRNLDQQLYERVLKPGLLKWCAVLPSIVGQRTFDYTDSGRPEWNPSTVEVGEEGYTGPKAAEYTGPALAADEQDVQRALGATTVGARTIDIDAATNLIIDPYPCIYRGEFLDDFGRDRAGRSVPLSQCARLNVPCHSRQKGIVNLGGRLVKPCETCEIRCAMPSESARPKLPLPEGHFNPSILMWNGDLILATRDSWGHAAIALWRLKNTKPDWTGDWLPEPIGSHRSSHPDAPRLEDPRLFIQPGIDGQPRLCAMLNLPDGYPPKRVQVGYVQFAPDLSGIEYTEVYASPQASLYEKNWVPFVHDGELHWVYATKPEHCIMAARATYRTPNPLPWAGGVIRGGAAPVYAPYLYPGSGHPLTSEGVYYHFFHGCLKRVQGSVYTVGCCVFEARPPFRVLRQTPVPLIFPDLPAVGEEVVKRYVVWPGGAVPHAGAWHLALGIDDTNCRIVRVSFADIESALADVPEADSAVSLRDTPLARGTRGEV